ncbi:nucleic acid/nucleotide deaminase domain-containing protein [Actinacidiphila acididurans]|uniref:Nucleic acid/nucleotide deaminase of polymorphic system toxin n=1 Tax=Actinacidiphila acididurans TaxID=2784346 RepID=A0ABS2U3P1_9ACTN|nr:nucleic acid/nucleotide deaminase domain-containing protein [Actinacidiphila acididurans]MBM9510229.1 hypothetical protein [Actinacidiphila acididurans]
MTNRIVQALEHGAGKLAKTLGEDSGKAIKDFYHDTGKRLRQDADDHLANDKAIADDMERIAKRHKGETDETPVYHLDDDGNITRLRHDPTAANPADRYRHEALTQDDHDRLGLDSTSIGGPREGERLALLKDAKEGRSKPRPTASSQRIPAGSTDLAQATQLARHADNSYGTHKKDTFTSNNYAAARVTGANGNGDFILVGRSHRPDGVRTGAHSERMIGIPFLRQGEGSRIQDLYTEREPCSMAPNCSSWVAERLPHVQVSHTVEYGDTSASRDAGNQALQTYLDGLKARR